MRGFAHSTSSSSRGTWHTSVYRGWNTKNNQSCPNTTFAPWQITTFLFSALCVPGHKWNIVCYIYFINNKICFQWYRSRVLCVCVYTCWPGASVGTLWRPTTRIFNSKRALSLYDNPLCVGTWNMGDISNTNDMFSILIFWHGSPWPLNPISKFSCSLGESSDLFVVNCSTKWVQTRHQIWRGEKFVWPKLSTRMPFCFCSMKNNNKKTTFVRLFGHKHFWLFILSSGLLVKTDVFSGQIDQQLSHSLSHTHKVQINGLKQIKDHFRTEFERNNDRQVYGQSIALLLQ